MGYLSCRADSSVATCRSITAISPLPISRRSYSGASGSRAPAPALPAAAATIELFAYAELEAATSHFADAALLGRGSHGAVYKAVLPSGRAVAVKRPSPRRAEVDNEIRILSSVRGPRLVNLLGYSDPGPAPSGAGRLLVVEYMPNGTLYDLLHSSPRPPGWLRRLRLALQTAAAVHLRPARASAAAGSTRAAGPAAAVRGDVEGDGEIGRDERLRQRHQLVRPRQLLLAPREPARLLLLSHGGWSLLLTSPQLATRRSNSWSSLTRRRASGQQAEAADSLDGAAADCGALALGAPPPPSLSPSSNAGPRC